MTSIAVASLFCQPALADTLESALAYAYANNPQLNSQRALVRATDEGVPTALAGYRPRASITANAGMQSLSTTIREIGSTTALGAPASYFTQSGVNSPHGVGATVTQNLLNGFQTANRTRQAEAQVFAARETLRNIEQTVLLNAATAYMNLLRDAGILELQRSNLDVLQEQLRQTKQRLDSGNVTATDLSQAEARLNVGRTQLFAAEANYASSRAVYRQVIGLDPGRLAPAAPVDRFVPHTLPAAMAAGIAQNPVVTVAQFNVDVATHQVKVAEGALYPVLSLQGNVQKNYETTLTSLQSFTASAAAQYSVPLYQGGAEYAAIRQAKETQGQKQMDLSVARDQARVSVVQAWAQLEASKSSIEFDPQPGEVGGGRLERRARGGPSRPAHHARRAQRPAGAGQRPDRGGGLAARPAGELLRAAGRDRPARAAGARPLRPELRPAGPLPPGSRRLGRRANARRAVTQQRAVKRKSS